jgi:chromate transporter
MGQPVEQAATDPSSTPAPSFSTALRFWLKLGLISFGGPSGQIAIMHRELVEKRRWISEGRFLHALNFCMLLPGPEATQLATYIGWLLHKTLGGIIAGTLFVLPSAVILWILSYVYVTYGTIPWVISLFYGLKAAVLAIVLSAVLRIGKRALKNPVMWFIAMAAFIALFFFKVPFPAVIATAALVGLIGGEHWKRYFLIAVSNHAGVRSVLDDASPTQEHDRPSIQRAFKVTLSCLVLWWLPVLGVAVWLGPRHTVIREAIFFSKAALVTFGGAYAVLPYVSQQAVEKYHWLSPDQMLDGLGLAETTPGPLVMVLQFVGFLGAYHQPATLPPLLAATLGAFITTWTTFVPCFLWIFLGAPYIERLRGNEKLTTALSAVTAAVVGVILNLALWFGLHLIFPRSKEIDLFALAVTITSFIVLEKCKTGVIAVIIGAAAVGVAKHLLGF